MTKSGWIKTCAPAHANGRYYPEAATARPLIAYIAHNFETELAADIARSFRGNLLCKAALIACKKPLTNNVTSVLIGATAAKLSAVPSGRL
jgi:hypothetical protein